MRINYDRQLMQLNRELIAMGGLCESAIASSARALLEGEPRLAEGVAEVASQIHDKERQIEDMCLKLILQQQPVASDLRMVSSALKMVTDLERIGHQSADIAEIISFGYVKRFGSNLQIHDMAQATIHMVTQSIDAYVSKDVQKAREVIAYDDVVDDHFDKMKAGLTAAFAADPSDAEAALDMLMIAKYFERIGDHAVNIGKWVLFSITGSREDEGK